METGTRPSHARADGFLAVAVILAVWKLAAVGIGTDIILPPPERVLTTLFEVIASDKFASSLGATILRGLAAFGISMLLGVAAGFAAGVSPRFESFMGPGLTIIRATPVLAVILIALIWFPSGVVPVFSAVIMAFPVVAADVSAGVRSADHRLLEMASAFSVSPRDASLYIRLPSAMPHVVSAAKNAVGLSWKVVVAGEVLSQPANALGTGMQNARIMLETAEVFAWASVGVVLCALSDMAFDLLARRLSWPTK
ncbi:MAG: ABC transporter permease subunit [Spirochaetia bacterium]|jgi:NitT/TauT family transport system permease protein|nr:ABC transporter permease subunit [Spirochaetia bacterium]